MINTTKKLILQNLQKRPLSHRELADAIRVTIHCIRHNVKVLREADEVFVSDWVRHADRGPFMAVLSAGKGKDKPEPKPLDNAKRMRLWRKDNPDYVVNQIMRQRKARAARKAAAPQPRAKQDKPQFWRMM